MSGRFATRRAPHLERCSTNWRFRAAWIRTHAVPLEALLLSGVVVGMILFTAVARPASRSWWPFSWGTATSAAAGAAAGATTAASFAVPFVQWLGFASTGIQAGSFAAWLMSLWGAWVPAGGLVATLQAIGATASLGFWTIPVVAVGGVVGGLIAGAVAYVVRNNAAAAASMPSKQEQAALVSGADVVLLPFRLRHGVTAAPTEWSPLQGAAWEGTVAMCAAAIQAREVSPTTLWAVDATGAPGDAIPAADVAQWRSTEHRGDLYDVK